MTVGMPADGAARFSRTRGRLGTSEHGLQYPSPFFDIAHTYLPATVKQMFRWCRYYFMVNPLINAVVFKMAEYPITDIIFDSENEHLKALWQAHLLEHMQYRTFQVEMGLDYYTYGNALVSIFYPFIKLLQCSNCKNKKTARDSTYTFRNYQFHIHCEKCGHHGAAKVVDHYVKAPRGIRLIRWNPEDVDIRYNDLTGEYTYYYEIPGPMKNDIIMGKKSTVETVPQLFIDALRLRKAVVFSRDNIYHFKRPTLAGKDRGWGTPMILPVLKDTFYLQILRKAQEAIALEHIVPLRILFPQAGSATSDPFCVSHDTLVETRGGLRPAGEVRKGDYLKSHTGAWRLVEAAVDRAVQDSEEVFEFTVAGLTAFPFKISEEHPLYSVSRPARFRGYDSLGEPDWVEAKGIQEGDFVCYPTRRITWEYLDLDLHDYCPERAVTDVYIYRRLNQQAAEIYEFIEDNGIPEFGHGERKQFLRVRDWSEQDFSNARTAFHQQDQIDRMPRFLPVTKELAYLIGLYAAEGSPKDMCASLALHTEETQIMDELDRCIAAVGFRPSTRSFRGNAATYEINDVFLAGLMVTSCGKGAQNKHLPRFILEAPLEVARAAARAVIKGDGCLFDTSTRRVGLKTTSPQLAMDVRIVLLSDGLIPTVQRQVPREDEIAKLPYYQVNLNGSQADAYDDRCPPCAHYRQAVSRSGFIRDGYVYLRVAKKEPISTVDVVRGFQMSGDRSFCVAGVATHNTTVNLQDWHAQVGAEIRRWRTDHNYIPILPLPVGHQTIGGDGRALLLSQEIRVWSEHIIAGMGIPVELIFGGLSFSGSNVSLRMLENRFLGYLQGQLSMLNWVVRSLGAYLGWPTVPARFKPFKMADDLQRKAYLFQLNQAGKLSDESLMADADFDSAKEDKIMLQESARRGEAAKKQQLQQAEVQGEAQMVMGKWQKKVEMQMAKEQMAVQNEMMKDQAAFQGQQQTQAMQDQMAIQQGQQPQQTPRELLPEPRQPGLLSVPQQLQSPLNLQSVRKISPGTTGEQLVGRANMDIVLAARQIADYMGRLDHQSKPQALAMLRGKSPPLHDMVLGLMAGGPQTQAASAAARPLPEQKPPRRGPESSLV